MNKEQEILDRLENLEALSASISLLVMLRGYPKSIDESAYGILLSHVDKCLDAINKRRREENGTS